MVGEGIPSQVKTGDCIYDDGRGEGCSCVLKRGGKAKVESYLSLSPLGDVQSLIQARCPSRGPRLQPSNPRKCGEMTANAHMGERGRRKALTFPALLLPSPQPFDTSN